MALPKHSFPMTVKILVALGQEIEWPFRHVCVTEGEVSLLAELWNEADQLIYRTKIGTYTAPAALPLLPKSNPVKIRIKAVADSELASGDETASLEETDQLARTIRQLLLSSQSEITEEAILDTYKHPEDIGELYHLLMINKLNLHERLIDSRIQLDGKARLDLFYEFEKASASGFELQDSNSPSIRSISKDPLVQGIEWLFHDQSLNIAVPRFKPTNKREYVREVLHQSNLIGREILLESDSLNSNCGPIIAFRGERNEYLFLRPKQNGYEAWNPAQTKPPIFIEKGKSDADLEQEDNLDPRAIAVQPALAEKDASKIGLVSFTYGKAGGGISFIPIGIIVGFAIGFLLSIGKEVGESRWIFGMTALGGLLGTTFTVLSPGFRTAVAATLVSTGIGLLTPAFNTILTNTALPDRDLGLMLQMGGILIAASLFTISLSWARSSTLIAAQQAGNVKLSFASIYRTLQLPTDFFSSLSIGDLSLRFSAISELQEEVKKLIEGGFIKAVLTTVYILFMLRISVKLTILSIFMALALLVPTAYIGLRSRRLERKSQEAEGEASGRNLELINSVSKLRMSGAEVPAARYWGEAYKKSIAYSYALDVQSSISKLLQTIVPNLGTLLLFIMVTRLTAEALSTPSLRAPNAGQLLGFFSAYGTFIGSMASLADLAIGAFDIPILWERAFPLLKTPIEILPDASDPGELSGAITLDRVSYRYKPELNLTLDRVSFEAKPGEFIALVGPSGSGKSTVVRMLLGFGNPEEGSVYYDGKPLPSLKLDLVRRQIGTVMQNSGIFSGSIFEVIAGSASISIDQAWEAAEMVSLADDIRDMPMGMQTVVPEGGGTLSGGQRQRLAIARALVRKPKILIFDEATSALDNRTQAIVTQSLETLQVTRVVIAHRLSTIRNADKIIVIEKGQVVETGRYEDLMSSPGTFYKLMSRQLA
jgi:ATP-binding cassette subfamily B protein